jgi:hypothetical protein
MYSPCGRPGTSTATESGLVEAGEIKEVAVGPVGVLDIVVAQADRGGGHHGDGIAAHELHQRAAPAREFLATDGANGGGRVCGSR